MNTPARPPRRNPDIKWKRVGAAGILLSLSTGEYFELDAQGMSIWTRLNGKTSVAALTAAVAERYRTTPRRIERDVKSFLTVLKKKRLTS